MTTLLENCRVTPPPEAETELTLSLTFVDLIWITFLPIRRLLFYEFTSSKSDFLNTAVPQLKKSLSLTLKHYLPAAGNLLYPLSTDENSKLPLIRYLAGDTVPFTVAESTADFDHLTGFHERDADEFYDFVPKMEPVEEVDGYRIVPVVAVKVTLFPNRGFCIGFSNLHVLGDASSIVGFIKSWASISKNLGGDEEPLLSSLPTFDRSYIKDPLGIDTIFWNTLKHVPLNPDTFALPTERIRATFVLQQSHIDNLKNMVLSKNPDLEYVSTFAVATAYAWTCLVKSGEEAERDEMYIFPVDARARVTPPVPPNYFGNFLSGGWAKIAQKEFMGDEGFVVAATAIAEEIRNRVNKKDELFKGAETWMSLRETIVGSTLGISGSPKFDLYGVDYGWGRAQKVEVVTIDAEKYSMSLCKSRDYEGGLEFGFSLSKERMDKFSTIFHGGLEL